MRFRGDPLRAHCHWPQTTLFSHVLSSLHEEQRWREATTHTAIEEDLTRCITLPSKIERGNQYLLVVTTSVGQLNLGPGGNNSRRSMAEENVFQNLQMVATLSTPPQGNQLWRCHGEGVEQIEDVTNLI